MDDSHTLRRFLAKFAAEKKRREVSNVGGTGSMDRNRVSQQPTKFWRAFLSLWEWFLHLGAQSWRLLWNHHPPSESGESVESVTPSINDSPRLKIDPHGLYFPRIIGSMVGSIIRLENITQSSVAFRFQSRFQSYVFDPLGGVLAPGESMVAKVTFKDKIVDDGKFKTDDLVTITSWKVDRVMYYSDDLYKQREGQAIVDYVLEVDVIDPVAAFVRCRKAMQLILSNRAKFKQVLENDISTLMSYISTMKELILEVEAIRARKKAQLGQIEKCALVASRMIAGKENLADIGAKISALKFYIKESTKTEEAG